MANATCKVCGNRYDKTMEIRVGGNTGTYDCFECAIHDLAPTCSNCQVRIVGHGVEAAGAIYCGAHCAGQAGEKELQDRA
jgi:hypothetical protein